MTTTILVLLIGLFVFMYLGVPIFASIGLSSMLAWVLAANVPLSIISERFYQNLNSFPLMAVPFFLLAAGIMEFGGIGKRIIELADAFVGTIRGGLAMTGLLACMGMATISGSSSATVAAIGSIIIPAMRERGYDDRFAVGAIVCGGTLGILLPPSIPLIIYGIVTGTSVVELFAAGIVPGIVLGVLLMLTTYVMAGRGWGAGEPRSFTFRERTEKVRQGIWTLLIPLVVFVGIYGVPTVMPGLFTPTEASMVTVFAALVVSVVIYRELRLRNLPEVVNHASNRISMIIMIITSALLLSFVVNNAQIPQALAAYVVSLHLQPWQFLLAVNVMLFIAGDFMDAIPIILMLIPVLFPSVVALKINPVQFGVMVVVNMELGAITPPVGLNLFVASTITGMKVYDVLRASAPWILVVTAFLMVVSYWPALSLWLPHVMGLSS